MSGWRVLNRLADRLSAHTGSDARARELRSHLIDLDAAGHQVSVADVASIGLLGLRAAGQRAIRDLPWWIAGLPIALSSFLLLATAYETHFFAWDMVDQRPESHWARSWQIIVYGVAALGALGAILAGRRVVEHLRHGRVLGPGLLITALVLAATQIDLFAERTPWRRDGRLKPTHVEEVPMYSVALIAGFALIPIVYLLADFGVTHTRRRTRSIDSGPLDPPAVIAVVLPLLMPMVSFLLIPPFIVLVWFAKPFSRLLKVAATAVITAPLTWMVFVSDIDGTAVLIPIFVVQGLVWIRMTVVALGPLRSTAVVSVSPARPRFRRR